MLRMKTDAGLYPETIRFLLEDVNETIRRKIAVYVRRYRKLIESGGIQDVDREVLVDMIERLPHIVQRFLDSGRTLTHQNFEAWLSTCIHRKVIDVIGAAPPASLPYDDGIFVGLPALPPADPVARARSHELLANALAVLDPLSRELLEARLLGGEKPESLAKRHAIPVGRVSDLIASAKLRIRNEVIAAITMHALAVRPNDQARFAATITSTCTRPHRCHAYRHPCPRAHGQGSGGRRNDDLINEVQRNDGSLLDDFADFVMVELDAWDLPPTLNRCYWAAK